MKAKAFITLSLAAFSLFAVEKTHLETTAPGDLISEKAITIHRAAKQNTVERNPVAISWAVEGEIAVTPEVYVAKSRSYRLEVEANAFDQGISLPVTSSGSVVRISPINQEASRNTIDPLSLLLVDERGQVFNEGRGIRKMVSDEDLRASKTSIFRPGTSVFTISDLIEPGVLLMYAEQFPYDGQGTYQIEVFEKGSSAILEAKTIRDTYRPGDRLEVDATMFWGTEALTTQAEGTIISPDGREYDLEFQNGRGSLLLEDSGDGTAGLWRVRIKASADDGSIRRDAQTAFAMVTPTARFDGNAEVNRNTLGLSASLGVEVGTAGRYETRAVLFGTRPDGKLAAVAIGHSANWFEPGQSTLELHFQQDLIEKSGTAAPFFLKDLRLIHQDRMGLLHRQKNGLKIN